MLTPEQQAIIENSIWVVNTALKRQGLQADEDLRQSAILYLCQCLERFDNTKGIQWTTFAYKNIYLYISRRNARIKRNNNLLVSEEMIDYTQRDENVFYDSEQRDILKQILQQCTPLERNILKLQMQGYTLKEISEKLNCSVSNITIKLREIKRRVQENERYREKD